MIDAVAGNSQLEHNAIHHCKLFQWNVKFYWTYITFNKNRSERTLGNCFWLRFICFGTSNFYFSFTKSYFRILCFKNMKNLMFWRSNSNYRRQASSKHSILITRQDFQLPSENSKLRNSQNLSTILDCRKTRFDFLLLEKCQNFQICIAHNELHEISRDFQT